MVLLNSVSAGNTSAGVITGAQGTGNSGIVRMSGNAIFGDPTAVSIYTGGYVYTYGDNQILGSGTATTSTSQKIVDRSATWAAASAATLFLRAVSLRLRYMSMKLFRFVVLIALCMSPLMRGQAAVQLLLQAGELHPDEAGIVILQTGTEANFAAGHIAGTRYFAFDKIATPMKASETQLSAELLDAPVLRANLAAIGVSDSSHVVVVFDATTNLTQATRLMFTLEYLGLADRTSFLNGGLPAWKAAGMPVTTASATITPGSLKVQTPQQVVVTHYFVQRMYDHVQLKLVDARAPEYYDGDKPTYGQAGHIPGAVNIPFSEFLTDKGEVNLVRLKADFDNNGIKQGDTVVAYCHIGMQATTVILGARLLGHSVLLYDGSFQDWATNDRGPVVK